MTADKKHENPCQIMAFAIVRPVTPFTFSYEFKYLVDINYCICGSQNLFSNYRKRQKKKTPQIIVY